MDTQRTLVPAPHSLPSAAGSRRNALAVAAIVTAGLLLQAGALLFSYLNRVGPTRQDLSSWPNDILYAVPTLIMLGVGALIALRIVWGLMGSGHARLSAMARTAAELGEYVGGRRAAVRAYVAHNPLGAWMAFALWAITIFVVATGWCLQLDRFWGDDTMQALHAYASYGLAALVEKARQHHGAEEVEEIGSLQRLVERRGVGDDTGVGFGKE